MIPVANEIPCPICGRMCKGKVGVSVHITKSHNREYGNPPRTATPSISPHSTVNSGQHVDPDDTNLDQSKQLSIFLQILKSNTIVLKRIPKAARIQVAIEFAKVLSACHRENSGFMSWVHLFTFGFVVFRSPDRKNKATSNLSIASIVKRNLDFWSTIKILAFDDFFKDILSNLPKRKKSKKQQDNETLRIKAVQAKLNDGDLR